MTQKYQEHLEMLYSVMVKSYGNEVTLASATFLLTHFKTPLSLLSDLGQDIPDPGYVHFFLAQYLDNCIKDQVISPGASVGEMYHLLCEHMVSDGNSTLVLNILDQAQVMTAELPTT